jgi:hypothetical protein
MISLASVAFCCLELAAIFKVDAVLHFRACGSRASLCVSSTLSNFNRVTFVGENRRDAEKEWSLGSEGGVLPELKMAAISAAPRNCTSGFGAATASGLAPASPYGIGVKLGGAAERGRLRSCPQGGDRVGPWLLTSHLASLCLKGKRDFEAGVCAPIHPRFRGFLTFGVESEIRPCLPLCSPHAVSFWWPGAAGKWTTCSLHRGLPHGHTRVDTSLVPGSVLVELTL